MKPANKPYKSLTGMVKNIGVLLVMLFAFTIAAIAQPKVIFYTDFNVSTNQMAIALTNVGFTVTTATSEAQFQTEITIPGKYQVAIYYIQDFSPNSTSVSDLVAFNAAGGFVIYEDWTRTNSYATNFGATFTGNVDQTSVTVTTPILTAGLPVNPITLVNPGWGVYSTGLVANGGSHVDATFGNGEAAIVSNAAHTAYVLGFFNDLSYNSKILENILRSFPFQKIATSVNNFNVCAGNTINVNYLSTTFGSGNTFNPGNVFTAYLSDSTGSFTSPISIGTLTGTDTSGTIVATIPANIKHGNGYRVLVSASNPVVAGTPDTVNITINPIATPNFSVGTACATSNVAFIDQSIANQGTITSYDYQFGDGSASLLKNPGYAYATAGIYNVTLTVTNSYGCSTSVTKAVTVNSKVTSIFTVNNATTCAGVASVFNNSSTSGANITNNWSFGDGTNSGLTSPSHTYTVAGNYTVTLIVNNTVTGCADTSKKIVAVNDKPVPSFSNNTVCFGDTTVFTNASLIGTGTMTYQWSFGDGGTSNNANPIHVYGSANSFTAKLIATSNNGCVDSVSQSVAVNVKPVAAFTFVNQCYGTAIAFANSSSGASTYNWDFGDGTTGNTANPSHTYTAPGTYIVILTAKNANGCQDNARQQITVYPLPVSDFDVSGACPGATMSFTNLCNISSGTLTYNWAFGDGGSSNLTSPTHQYLSAGSYNVTLTATSNNGCITAFTKSVTVYSKPTPNFTAANQCFGTAVDFINTTTVPNGAVASYQWKFGDGNSSTDINPSHLYATAGIYTVTLYAQTSQGCIDSITHQVQVYSKPVASFTVSNNAICLDSLITFTNTSTGTGLRYIWNFGDSTFSSNISPVHFYFAAGTYIVTLIDTNANGCADTTSQTITVYPHPTAGFVADTVCQGNITHFTSLSTIAPGTLSYAWNFGDGTTSTSINPTHTYAVAGNYTTSLTITSNNGCIDTVSHRVVVNVQPVASFTAVQSTVCDSVAVQFVNNSTGSVNSTSLWNFGDGNTDTSVAPSHIYAGPGSYTVSLLIRDTVTGCLDSMTGTVTVSARPEAKFQAKDICIGVGLQFLNTSTISVGTMSYNWAFGDTTFSTDINPVHLYDSIGIKNVTLIATSNLGCTDTVTNTIIVYPQPVANFSASNTCFGKGVVFTNLDSIAFGTDTYNWSFGDGTTDTASNPTHVFPALGLYNITLTSTSNKGCGNSISKSIVIEPNPTANFIGQNVCKGDSVHFTNLSTAPSGTFTSLWSFGDSSISALNNPVYQYAKDSTYNATLLITTNNGCKDSITKQITIYPLPTVNFTAPDVCIGESTHFTNVSIVRGGAISEVSWDFGDNEVSAAISPNHKYAFSGTYQVTLVVTSTNGCVDSIKKIVLVHKLPNAKINPLGPVAFCQGDSTQLSAGITGTDHYHWSTGDTTQVITVKTSGLFHVTVTSQYGCEDSDTLTVTVWALPIAEAGNDTTISKGYLAHLHGSGGVTYDWTPADSTIDNPNAQNPNVRPLTNTTYIVLVTDSNGCKNTDSVNITVNEDYLVMITNVFTPNGDGKNDYFEIINITTYPNCEVLIFDSWGTRVYESKGYHNEWRGTYKDKDLPEGTYYYVVRFDGFDRLYKGAVSILR